MTEDRQCVRPEVVLDALLTQDARVADDIVEVGEDTWAIHGVTPVDGDVILAEFHQADDARTLLERLAIVERRPTGTGGRQQGAVAHRTPLPSRHRASNSTPDGTG